MKLSIKAAAKTIGVSKSLLYQWCQEQRLAHYRLGGTGRRGTILIDSDELDQFLHECRIERHALLNGSAIKRLPTRRSTPS